MNRNDTQKAGKALRYLIGASIMVLALMLFSGLCSVALGFCVSWFPLVKQFGFWEVMGISAALLLCAMASRAILVRRRFDDEIPPSDGESEAQVPTEPGPPGSPAHRRSPRWRQLLDQLTQEEKRRLKTIIEEQYLDVPAASTAEEQTLSK